MFRFGEMSVLMNSHLVREQDKLPDVRFRIIGRDAIASSASDKKEKPSMSWSVPFSRFWVMPKRIKKDLMNPMPVEIADLKDLPVLENFKQG